MHEDTNKYKVYSHHKDMERPCGSIALEPGMESQPDDPSKPKFSFANLLRHLHPIVIVDEAHHMVTDLSNKALAKIAAGENAAKAGEYVRPIVLFQATNKNGTVPVEKLKAQLVEVLKIPEPEVRIATGDQKELDDVDVMSPSCGVNYVITVEALKEGWDCPFAYVFCSLANVGSSKDTIQLLGRVMRMPYAKRRKARELNRAYAFVMSAKFGGGGGADRRSQGEGLHGARGAAVD